MLLNKRTAVTKDNAEAVIIECDRLIEELKSSYGFIGKGWKPIPVSHPHLYQKRAEAKRLQDRTNPELTE